MPQQANLLRISRCPDLITALCFGLIQQLINAVDKRFQLVRLFGFEGIDAEADGQHIADF